MNRDLRARKGRHGDLDQMTIAEIPSVRSQGTQTVADAAEERASFLALLVRKPCRHEVIRARQRTDVRGERRRVVVVPELGEEFERRAREAEARAAEPARVRARRGRDRVGGTTKLRLELGAPVPVEPRFLIERMVADLVAGVGERAERGTVLLRARRPGRRRRR